MRIYAECLTVLFVIGMVLVAEQLQAREILFPEIAALAFGAWVMEERPWRGPAWTIWLSPTLGALTGILLMRFAPLPPPALVTLAFALVLVELKIFRSAMSPSFSAAILPIVTGGTSWIYPAAVCVMAAIVAAVAALREKKGGSAKNRGGRFPCGIEKAPERDALKKRIGRPVKLILCVLIAALIATWSGWTFLMAPPLIVAFVELAEPTGALRKKSRPRLLLLFTLTSLAGTLCVLVTAHGLAWPLWIGAGLAASSAFLLVRALGAGAPPAFALALLPAILPRDMLPLYPVQVLAGSLLFSAFLHLGFRGKR